MRLRLSATLAGILVAVGVSNARAQTNVGQLLDSGAVKLSAEEFRQQVVGRVLAGPGRGLLIQTSIQEVVYLDDGIIRGSGSATTFGGMTGGGQTFVIEGTWTIDDRGRICQSTRAGNVVLAPRCQYWFKHSDKFYFADSDTDRSAVITVRNVKKT
jgi:hypothetical protein